MTRHAARTTVADRIGLAAIHDGYVVRRDGVVIGLAELTPPDPALLGETELAQVLTAYQQILQTTPERMGLHTYTIRPDVQRVLDDLHQAQETAPDVLSFTVLAEVQAMLTTAYATSTQRPVVRWILSVPSLAPAVPPAKLWDELHPQYTLGTATPFRGDAVTEVMRRTGRLVTELAALGLTPPPRVLDADAIIALLGQALDPVHAADQPAASGAMARPLQVAAPD
ncbi:MAG: hypothetical protein HC828_02275 [Blastochloris sp.]|nr:hypothetical protein [Blastochloris sp.]